MLGTMNLARKDCSEKAYEILRTIREKVGLKPDSPVRLGVVHRGGYQWSYRTTFAGVTISIEDNRYHTIQRRVMVKEKVNAGADSTFSIDLNKVKEKVVGLMKMKEEFDRQAEVEKRQRREEKEECEFLQQGLSQVSVSKTLAGFRVVVSQLNADGVKQIVALIKTL